MPTPKSAAPSARSRWRVALLWTMGMFAPVSLWLVLDHLSARQLETARTALAGSDPYADWEAFASSRMRDGEPAAHLVARAFETLETRLTDLPSGTTNPGDVTKFVRLYDNDHELTAARCSDIRSILARPHVQDAFALLHVAANRDALCRAAIDNSWDCAQELADVGRAVEVLTARAVLTTELGLEDASPQADLHAAMALLTLAVAAPDPSAIVTVECGSNSLRKAILNLTAQDSRAIRYDELIAPLEELSGAMYQLDETLLEAARFSWLESFYEEDYRGHRDWVSTLAAAGSTWEYRPPAWLSAPLSGVLRPRLAFDLRECYGWLRRVHASTAAPDAGYANHWRKLRADVPDMEPSCSYLLKASFLDFLLSRLRAQSTVRTTALAIAATKHRVTHGTWPRSVDEIEVRPETRIDACSGLPFRFMHHGGDLVIYGCGFDGDDDGGRAIVPDLTFACDGPIEFDLDPEGDLVVRLSGPGATRRE